MQHFIQGKIWLMMFDFGRSMGESTGPISLVAREHRTESLFLELSRSAPPYLLD